MKKQFFISILKTENILKTIREHVRQSILEWYNLCKTPYKILYMVHSSILCHCVKSFPNTEFSLDAGEYGPEKTPF